jgi:hypothetical protein
MKIGMAASTSAWPRCQASSSPRCSWQYAASTTTTPSLANSDGCSWKEPTWYQAWIPRLCDPSGVSTPPNPTITST